MDASISALSERRAGGERVAYSQCPVDNHFVLEVFPPEDCVHRARLAGAVFVLHVFRKKSKTGRETAKADIDMIERRMREAERISEGERR